MNERDYFEPQGISKLYPSSAPTVLVPCRRLMNPVLSELKTLLEDRGVVLQWHVDSEAFHLQSLAFDIVHIQWPEALCAWRDPSEDDLASIGAALKHWRERSKICVTVHNRKAHFRDTLQHSGLYRMVYESADIAVHLGETSIELFKSDYPDLDHIQHVVIPHKAYTSYQSSLSKRNARRYLGLDPDDAVLLCFGRLRHESELDLLLDAFERCRIPRKRLLISRPPAGTQTVFTPQVILGNSNEVITHADTPNYFSAADLALIPRRGSLNSGVAVLALSLGVAVVGPDEGVIGEMLRAAGNTVYTPGDASAFSAALEQAYESADRLGILGRRYAENALSDDRIAALYAELYSKLAETAR